MICRRQNSASKPLLTHELRSDDVFFGGLAQRRYVLIFVDNGIADKSDPRISYLLDQVENALSSTSFPSAFQIRTQFGIQHIHVPSDQSRRCKGDVIGKGDTA